MGKTLSPFYKGNNWLESTYEAFLLWKHGGVQEEMIGIPGVQEYWFFLIWPLIDDAWRIDFLKVKWNWT